MHHRTPSAILVGMLTVAALIVTASVGQASPISLIPNDPNSGVLLSDLMPGGQFQDGAIVGDKIFTDFFYSTLPNDDMPDANQIEVFGFTDLDNNLGLSFHGAFLDLPGGGPSDALLRFTVEVSPSGLESGFRISDAHLFLGGVGLGPNSFFAVDESFQGLNETLSAYATTFGGTLQQDLADEVVFSQTYTKIRVTKDILAIAGNDSQQPARATVIDQSFSQEGIPEPSSLSLSSVLGLMGLAAARRPGRRDNSA